MRPEIPRRPAAVCHVPDDEVCWCGVPLDVHVEVYAEVGGAGHRPDPQPPPVRQQRQDRLVLRFALAGIGLIIVELSAVLVFLTVVAMRGGVILP